MNDLFVYFTITTHFNRLRFAQPFLTMRLPTSTLYLAVFCLFCSWTQAYLVSANTCSDPTIALITSSMKRIFDATEHVKNGISQPLQGDDTNQRLYMGATETSFHNLSENARQIHNKWDWTRQTGKMVNSLVFTCRESQYAPASNWVGNQWKVTREKGTKGTFKGPSYEAADQERTLCAPNDMIQTLFNEAKLIIVLCQPIKTKIQQGYEANKDMEYWNYLQDNLNDDHLVREIFRALYMHVFPEHTAAIDAYTGWAECDGMLLEKALTNFYSFAYSTLAFYFTKTKPGSFFVGGHYLDSEAYESVDNCVIDFSDLDKMFQNGR
ncbi:hypothetical protein BDV95DRAFT_382246 [Massariosphaeria phaeospora]|uniref:Uncharacterized protein n=1 Tax=Massariosphaeria phaeospora TaxID=100035 RepID=A0A7C8I741_9PLEO|nr:hypothetical protein BDV95DRAFT_382246 [Massariosphaeria phaeospora]